MQLRTQQTAPDFKATDVYGTPIQLSDLKGKKVLLSFHRNVGCPICNLRFHQLQQQAGYFAAHNLVMIDIYESSAAHMLGYLENTAPRSMMVPDPGLQLYKMYGIERSWRKVMLGLFKGGFAKMKAGNRLFGKKLKQDGAMDRIGADFLLDENGTVLIAWYGKYIGDNLPITAIREAMEK